jgi:hypothetical protein
MRDLWRFRPALLRQRDLYHRTRLCESRKWTSHVRELRCPQRGLLPWRGVPGRWRLRGSNERHGRNLRSVRGLGSSLLHEGRVQRLRNVRHGIRVQGWRWRRRRWRCDVHRMRRQQPAVLQRRGLRRRRSRLQRGSGVRRRWHLRPLRGHGPNLLPGDGRRSRHLQRRSGVQRRWHLRRVRRHGTGVLSRSDGRTDRNLRHWIRVRSSGWWRSIVHSVRSGGPGLLRHGRGEHPHLQRHAHVQPNDSALQLSNRPIGRALDLSLRARDTRRRRERARWS